MVIELNSLEQRVLDSLPLLSSEDSLIEYKNTILGKAGELTIILK